MKSQLFDLVWKEGNSGWGHKCNFERCTQLVCRHLWPRHSTMKYTRPSALNYVFYWREIPLRFIPIIQEVEVILQEARLLFKPLWQTSFFAAVQLLTYSTEWLSITIYKGLCCHQGAYVFVEDRGNYQNNYIT